MGLRLSVNRAHLNPELDGHVNYDGKINCVSYVPKEGEEKAKILLELNRILLYYPSLEDQPLFSDAEIRQNKTLSVDNRIADYGGKTDICAFKGWPRTRNQREAISGKRTYRESLDSELGVVPILSVFQDLDKLKYLAELSTDAFMSEHEIITQRLMRSGIERNNHVYPTAISVVQEEKPLIVAQYPDDNFPTEQAFNSLATLTQVAPDTTQPVALDEKEIGESREVLVGWKRYNLLIIGETANREYLRENADDVRDKQILLVAPEPAFTRWGIFLKT